MKSSSSLTLEFLLIQENILIQNERITQLYVIQSADDPKVWFGVLFIDSGIYFGSVVRFKVVIDESYPDCSCPKVFFDPIPYHPLVNPTTGELDTKNAFPKWNSNTHKLYQLLIFVKRVIRQADIYISQIQELFSQDSTMREEYIVDDNSGRVQPRVDETRQNSNSELIDMFMFFNHTLNCIRTYENNRQEFSRFVEEFKQECGNQLFKQPKLFGIDNNALVFTHWNPEIHEKMRACILAGRFVAANLYASYHKETDSVSFIPGVGEL